MRNCVSEIHLEDAHNIDVVMSLYDLTEYGTIIQENLEFYGNVTAMSQKIFHHSNPK